MSGIADDRVPREWVDWWERHRPPDVHIPAFYETTRRLASTPERERILAEVLAEKPA